LVLALTPAETDQLREELTATLIKFRDLRPADAGPAQDVRDIFVFAHAFPMSTTP
jgi:hypothetical protein